jgi:CRISPR-associated protein Csb2
LRYLQDRFDAKVRPTSALWQGYAEARQEERPQPEIVGSRFDSDLIVLRQSAGRRFGLSSTLLLTKVLRDTLMSHCSRQPPPEWLSGHRADGRPGEREYGHLAVFPLPHVGRLHADGHLLGLAISIPRDVSRNELYSCLGDLFFDENQWPKRIKLTLGRLGECVLEIDEGSSPRVALNPATWLKPSRTWATVTPLALDRHPKPRDSEAAIAEIVNRSCLRVGLPSPQTIIPETVSRFVGAPTSREMPRITRKNDGSPVCQTHAKITFPCEVQGPVLLGTGRYRGYGLCRPINPAEVRA